VTAVGSTLAFVTANSSTLCSTIPWFCSSAEPSVRWPPYRIAVNNLRPCSPKSSRCPSAYSLALTARTVGEVAATYSLFSGTLAKTARDLSLHMQTEVGELAEPSGAGRGGSSTMPHKENPVTCAAILAATSRIPALVSTVLSAISGEYQRSLGPWQSEWKPCRKLFV
jgi:hypothetical protein